MNRRSFLAFLGLAPFAPKLVKAALAEPPATRTYVAERDAPLVDNLFERPLLDPAGWGTYEPRHMVVNITMNREDYEGRTPISDNITWNDVS